LDDRCRISFLKSGPEKPVAFYLRAIHRLDIGRQIPPQLGLETEWAQRIRIDNPFSSF
jgi:hypothetical protein